MNPLRWTSKSTYGLADALRARGFEVSATLVGELGLARNLFERFGVDGVVPVAVEVVSG
jgi:hypothetical protein